MRRLKNQIAFIARISLPVLVMSVSLFGGQGNDPIIIIPGMTGSELRHKDTGDKIWFKALKSRSEDIRLPVVADPTKTHDDLIATDVLRNVKVAVFPVYDVYGALINALQTRGGYREESWDTPSADGYKDSIYVFAYDWRLDNVGNARLLVRRIDALRTKLQKPELKFDIIAHSMGGLIARYAAMYGDADLPPAREKPHPTWAGAAYFDRIVMLGTPNEGSAQSLNVLVNGYSVGNVHIDLPFVQDSSKFLVFTIPSVYELMPAPGTFRVYDDHLKLMTVDIYDPKTWEKFGWRVIDDKDFASRFSGDERKAAPAYFAAILDRARRWQEALAADGDKNSDISFYLVGSDCRTAPDSIVIYRDRGKWKTTFRPNGFKRSDGVRISDEDMKKLMIAPGDGIVTRRSLEAPTNSAAAGKSVLHSNEAKIFCETHNHLPGNTKVQDYVMGLLKKGNMSPKEGN